jgi:hypothetical protein
MCIAADNLEVNVNSYHTREEREGRDNACLKMTVRAIY